MAAGDPIAADQKRTEVTPVPFSAIAAWDLDTNAQETLAALLISYPVIAVLQEFALAQTPGPNVSEAWAGGMQIGARNIIQKLLNMTRDRVVFNAGKHLQQKASQVGGGIPTSKQLRPVEKPESRRLTGPIRQPDSIIPTE